MNAFDLLNEKEKRVLSQMLKGLTLSQVADIYKCTTGEVNNVRL
jgi:DNA-binding CsgD family transcriptional regulator